MESFETLLTAHRGILYKVCNSYCPNADDREDLAQEIAIQLWKNFKRFDGRAKFSTWMYRVALNVAISFHRRERARIRHLGEQLLDAPDPTANHTEAQARLNQFLDSLDPLNKALVLLYLDGFNYAEIGEVLGISESNAATKLSRIKKGAINDRS